MHSSLPWCFNTQVEHSTLEQALHKWAMGFVHTAITWPSHRIPSAEPLQLLELLVLGLLQLPLPPQLLLLLLLLLLLQTDTAFAFHFSIMAPMAILRGFCGPNN